MELISYVLVIVKLSSEAVAKQCFTNKTVLKNLLKITGKYLYLSLLLIKLQAIGYSYSYIKAVVQLRCFLKNFTIFQITFLTEHLQATASISWGIVGVQINNSPLSEIYDSKHSDISKNITVEVQTRSNPSPFIFCRIESNNFHANQNFLTRYTWKLNLLTCSSYNKTKITENFH